MDTKKAYKQKSEAEFELMKAKLSVLKASAKVKIAQGRIEYAKDMVIVFPSPHTNNLLFFKPANIEIFLIRS